jgi:hypothetical protein
LIVHGEAPPYIVLQSDATFDVIVDDGNDGTVVKEPVDNG